MRESKNGKLWLNKQIEPYRKSITLITFMTVLGTAFSVLFAYLVSYVVDSATNKDNDKLLIFSLVILALLLARIGLRAINVYYTETCRVKISTGLRNKLFKKILKSRYSEVKDYHSGELVARITADSTEIAGSSVSIMPQTAGMIIQFIGALIALVFIDALLTLFLIVGGGLIIGISYFLKRKMKWYHKEIMSLDAKSKSFMQESIVSNLTVKAFEAEDKFDQSSQIILDDYKKKRVGRAKINSLVGILYSIVANFGLIFAIIWCALSIMNNSMEYGAILSVVLLMEQLQRPLNSISSVLPVYYSRLASAERLCEIDCFKDDDLNGQGQTVEYNKVNKIVLENAKFSYEKDVIFESFNLDIIMGKITCIHGVSGVGKSTLFKLILGVYELDEGRIYFDLNGSENNSVDITAKNRNLFSYVPQGNFLFSGSIYENLTYFSSEENEEKLKDLVKKAIEVSCSDFVYDLPNGLDTVLAEQGVGLSEGQRQRLAVARALVANRPILLLDEATSALDEETEKKMMQNIKNLENTTCIIISHRQAVLDIADYTVKIN